MVSSEVNTGFGYTVTIKVSVFVQLLAVKVNIYVTSMLNAVVLINVSSMIPSVAILAALLMPVTASRVQLNEVLGTSLSA